ncbi:MAG: tetratricopeptide repeat protein, partial [Dokdonella sp.]|nr:tetratricopeptide repeat protein [Dokdonella sp.]
MRRERAVVVCLLALAIAGCASSGGGSRPSSVVDAPAKSNPDDPRTKAAKENTELGLGYMRQGKLEIALEKLNKALSADPRYTDAHTVIAVLYEQIGDRAKAEEHY